MGVCSLNKFSLTNHQEKETNFHLFPLFLFLISTLILNVVTTLVTSCWKQRVSSQDTFVAEGRANQNMTAVQVENFDLAGRMPDAPVQSLHSHSLCFLHRVRSVLWGVSCLERGQCVSRRNSSALSDWHTDNTHTHTLAFTFLHTLRRVRKCVDWDVLWMDVSELTFTLTYVYVLFI